MRLVFEIIPNLLIKRIVKSCFAVSDCSQGSCIFFCQTVQFTVVSGELPLINLLFIIMPIILFFSHSQLNVSQHSSYSDRIVSFFSGVYVIMFFVRFLCFLLFSLISSFCVLPILYVVFK